MTRPDTTTKHATDVSAMFDEVSPKYDLLNDVLSVGNSRLWRIATTRAIAPRKGMRILDLAAGTGTSSAALAAHGAHVTAADFSEGMLAEGRRRNAGNDLIDFVWADATQLPFEDDSFDAATISYGLRNVSEPKQALAEMARVVKPGGRVVIAEFSQPPAGAVNWAYTQYNRHVLPRVAGVINRDAAEAYRYLNESIETWPGQEELASWLREAGLERVAYRNLTLGIVALHRGFVPRAAKQAPSESAAVKKPGTEKAAQSQKAAATPAAKKTAEPQASATDAAATKASSESKPASAKTDAPKTDAPKTAAQKTAGTQKTTATEQSTAKKPATKKPAAKKPATTKPAGAKGAGAKPATTTGAAKKPATKKPAAKKPAEPKSADKPSTPKTETSERGHE